MGIIFHQPSQISLINSQIGVPWDPSKPNLRHQPWGANFGPIWGLYNLTRTMSSGSPWGSDFSPQLFHLFSRAHFRNSRGTCIKNRVFLEVWIFLPSSLLIRVNSFRCQILLPKNQKKTTGVNSLNANFRLYTKGFGNAFNRRWFFSAPPRKSAWILTIESDAIFCPEVQNLPRISQRVEREMWKLRIP